jgi:hypothetical protein
MATDPYNAKGKTSLLPSPAATAAVVSDKYFSIGKKNFEPRFGLAWQVDANGKTVVRVGAGIYHNQILPWIYYQGANIAPFYGLFNINNPAQPFPMEYQDLVGVSPANGNGKVGLVVMAPFIKTPVNYQYNLSIQQQISKTTVLQVAYAGSHASNLPAQRELDTPVPIICSTALNNCPAGVPNGQKYFPAGAPRQNPAWAGISTIKTDANALYNSLQITLRRQFSGGLQGQVFYTFSKAQDEASNISSGDSVRSSATYLDPTDPARDWALSEFDSRHNLIADFLYPIPFRASSKALGAVVNGWALDGILTFKSGLPFTAFLSANVSRNGAIRGNERPNLKPGANNNPNGGTSVGCAGLAAGTPVGNPTHWYDPCSFSLPLAGTYGNLGRDTIIGPGVAEVDLALQKTFPVYERLNATFRFEAFNIANHANFGLPNMFPLTTAGTANASAGLITYTTTSARQLQFAVRINF